MGRGKEGVECEGVCIPDLGYSGFEKEKEGPRRCVKYGRPGCGNGEECVNRDVGTCAQIDGQCLGTCEAVGLMSVRSYSWHETRKGRLGNGIV